MSSLRILLADDERPARFGMAKALAQLGAEIVEADNGQAALEAIRSGTIDLAFLDLSMPVVDGQGVLRALAGSARPTEIVVVTANDAVQSAVECIRLGAADYITKPYEIEQLRAIARRVRERLALQRQVHELQERLEDRTACGAILGISRAMRDLFALLNRAAAAPIDVLIQGETGTGKELIAREIHRLSPRCGGPFVAVNTAAIAESLAESEMFGHVRGAFTGAERDRPGFFEQAHGGTLFLDEIGDMPLAAQGKILRALQERVVQPVGSTRTIEVDVRVLSATHQDLECAAAEGNFRRDLYYRLRGITLAVPPLRSRREDIVLLAEHFLARHASATGVVLRFSPGALDQLLAYHWPGNVRELEQTVRAAAALAATDSIGPDELRMPAPRPQTLPAEFAALAGLPLTQAKAQLVEAFERAAIQGALDQHQGNISAAARQLGIHRQNLQQKMAQLGIR